MMKETGGKSGFQGAEILSNVIFGCKNMDILDMDTPILCGLFSIFQIIYGYN